MEHTELSTTMSSQRPQGSRDGKETRRRKVWVLEGGYTADTRHWENTREKELQHAQLLPAIQFRGFTAKLLVLTIGLGGTVYQQAEEDLRVLGVSITFCEKYIKSYLSPLRCKIGTQRRIMDRQKLLHSTEKPLGGRP